jgi:tetratricopeptide (TPR) repeat protein
VLKNNFELEPEMDIHYSGFKEVLNNLITLFKGRKEYEKAVEMYDKMLAAQQRVIDLKPDEWEYRKDLAATYTSFALLYSEKGDLEKEAHYHRLSLDILEKVVEKYSDDPEELCRFVTGLYVLGSTLRLGEKNKEKESSIVNEYLELAQKADEKLQVVKPEIIREKELLAEITERMGIALRENEMYEKAIEEFKSSLAIREKLHEKNPENLNYLTVLESTYYQMGITFLATENLEKAKEALEKAMNLNAQLLETDSEDFDYLSRASMIFEKYSDVLEKMGKSEEAAQYLKKAEEINTRLEEDSE